MRTTTSSKYIPLGILAGICCFIPSAGKAVAVDTAGAPASVTPQPIVQTRCPVLENQDVDPNIYSDYQGKRVYFCCVSCKADFDANPEKYLAQLPQFAATQPGKTQPPKKRATSWMHEWIEPAGATTLTLLMTTVCLALLRRVRWPRPGFILKLHKIAGICTLCSGVFHATLVLLH